MADSPILPAGGVGIFDSGVGGLSVLRHVRAALPAEHLVYCADAGYAPYGDKPEALIVARAQAIAAFLVAHGIKALVVACNTATAAAIAGIRRQHPQLVVVGVEPGLKPAAQVTTSRVVGVLATTATLASARFAALQAQIAAASGVRFVLQPCPGLADQIEKGELRSAATMRLIDRLVAPLLDQGVDTLVLGCTHYPFVAPLIAAACARRQNRAGAASVSMIDTGEAVARQLASVLRERALLSPAAFDAGSQATGIGADAGQAKSAPASAVALASLTTLTALTTGSASSLAQAFRRLLALEVAARQIRVEVLPAPAQGLFFEGS